MPGTVHRPNRPAAASPERPAPGEFHLWLAPVRPHRDWLDLLDPEEQRRAGRLAGTPAGDVFVTSRAVQRLVGSRYLAVPPRELIIDRDCPYCRRPGTRAARHGRPRFRQGIVDYSVSHTERWVLLAVTGAGLIGVDIEAVISTLDFEGLARATLTAAERECFRRLPGPERPASLLKGWTRKEAAMKLTGLGLKAPPNQIDVSGPAASAEIPQWPATAIHLYSLDAPNGHVAALATTVPLITLRWFELAAALAAGAHVIPR